MDVVQLRPALTVEHVTRLVTSQASDSSVHASQTSLESSVKLVSLVLQVYMRFLDRHCFNFRGI